MPEDMIDVEMAQIGTDRLKQFQEIPKLVQRIGQLELQLAECRTKMFNTPEYTDINRRCCNACNESADLRKLVDELRAENAVLRSGGGYPPPLVSGGTREIQ